MSSERKKYIVELFAPPLKLLSSASIIERVIELTKLSKKVKTPIEVKLRSITDCEIIDLNATFFTLIVEATEEVMIVIAKFPEVRYVVLDKHHR